MNDPQAHDATPHMYCNTCKNDWESQHGMPLRCTYCGSVDIAPAGETPTDLRTEDRFGERCGE